MPKLLSHKELSAVEFFEQAVDNVQTEDTLWFLLEKVPESRSAGFQDAANISNMLYMPASATPWHEWTWRIAEFCTRSALFLESFRRGASGEP